MARSGLAPQAAVHGGDAGGVPGGSQLPAPAANPSGISIGQNDFLSVLNTFSGGGLTRLSVFALGIVPYVTASIILRVMTPVFPSLRAQKEGELGQRRIRAPF